MCRKAKINVIIIQILFFSHLSIEASKKEKILGDEAAILEFSKRKHGIFPGNTSLVYGLHYLKRIETWPFLSNLDHHRIYSFWKGNNFHLGIEIAAVDDSFLVTDQGSVVGFNSILKTEIFDLSERKDAMDFVHDFLRSNYALLHFHYDNDFGLNAISSLTEIKFVNDQEQFQVYEQLQLQGGIQPPKLRKEGENWRYELFSWNIFNGNIYWHEISFGQSGISNLESNIVLENVGDTDHW